MKLFDLDDLFLFDKTPSNFPKYDLYTEGKLTVLEVALAGYKREDLTVFVNDKNYLFIKTVDDYKPDEYPNRKYVYGGLAKRKFSLSFKIKSKFEIKECELKDGILKLEIIELEEKQSPLQVLIK
jgi:HSP20 family molecular chaperone IbpA